MVPEGSRPTSDATARWGSARQPCPASLSTGALAVARDARPGPESACWSRAKPTPPQLLEWPRRRPPRWLAARPAAEHEPAGGTARLRLARRASIRLKAPLASRRAPPFGVGVWLGQHWAQRSGALRSQQSDEIGREVPGTSGYDREGPPGLLTSGPSSEPSASSGASNRRSSTDDSESPKTAGSAVSTTRSTTAGDRFSST